jgi:phospholipid/cholesterol/gamma-HCH transport system substrate-binding protein
MKFSIRFADQIVGTFVILALAILVVVILMLGRSQRWFVRDNQYYSYFSSANGLSANMAVQFKGFTIGHVKKITLTSDDQVEVIFSIFAEHQHRVREGSLVELQASPIGLGNTFIFHPGKGEEELLEWSVIHDINSRDAARLTETGLADKPVSTDSIGNIITNVENITNDVSKVINDLSENIDPLLRDLSVITSDVTLITGDLSRQISPIIAGLAPIISDIEKITNQLSSPEGTVMSLLDQHGPLLGNIDKTLNSVSEIMKSLENTAEFIPTQLPQIMILISQLNSTLVEVQKTVTALNNNPLLRGGIPEVIETSPGAATPRDHDF